VELVRVQNWKVDSAVVTFLSVAFHALSLTCNIAMLRVCLLVALLALPAPASAGTSPQNSDASTPDLLLLFNANVSRACAGQCTLQASAANCATALSGGGSNASEPAHLEEWNNILLDWQQAHGSSVRVSFSCADPTCQPTPARFLAWHGAECDDAGTAAGGALAPLRAELMMHNLFNDSYRLYMLNAEQPAVAISFQPLPPPAACPTHGSAQHPPTAASSSADSSHPPQESSQAVYAGAAENHCASRVLLQLMLVAWTLGCAALAAKL
jgi:hypothetical protein